MKVDAPDLTRTFPRSPREKLGGYLHLARMIDKARAKAADRLGEYIYPCPMDQSLLAFLAISPEAFYEKAETHEDQDILNWIRETTPSRSPEAIEDWNHSLIQRKPKDEESLKYFLETRNRIAPERTDVETWVDLIDLEENRLGPPRISMNKQP